SGTRRPRRPLRTTLWRPRTWRAGDLSSRGRARRGHASPPGRARAHHEALGAGAAIFERAREEARPLLGHRARGRGRDASARAIEEVERLARIREPPVGE